MIVNSIIYETCIDENLTFFNEKVSFNPIELIKKAFDWIINKINRAINFIKDKLKRKSKEEDIQEKPKKEIKIKIISVSPEFVKKCYLYYNAEYIQNKFIKKDCKKIETLSRFDIDIQNDLLSNPRDILGNIILYVKDTLFPQINNAEWKYNNNTKIIYSKNHDIEDTYIDNKKIDIIKLLQNFKRNIEILKNDVTDAYDKINDMEEERKQKIQSSLSKRLNIIKNSSSWYISQLTKLINFDPEYEINKLLEKSNN